MRGMVLIATLAVLAGGAMAQAHDFAAGSSPGPDGMNYGPPAFGPAPSNVAPAGHFAPAFEPPPAHFTPAFDPTPALRPPVAMPSSTIRPLTMARESEATWYVRTDYFRWNERVDGLDFVTEDGLLTTLGYQRRVGPERFRAELFGGRVGYDGGVQYDDGSTEPLLSHTKYLGVRGEYDLLYEPEWFPAASFVAGIGTRFWYRDLPDDYTASGTLVWGYQETWWTVYPYLGLETRRPLRSERGLTFYASGRIGATALTHEHVSWDDVTLYPKAALIGQCEVGLSGPFAFVGLSLDSMNWGESPIVRGILQPRSTMLTAGLRAGFSF